MSYGPSSLTFSAVHAQKRVDAASRTLGEGVVKRLLAFALFLLGARREAIAQYLSLPLGTLLSLLTRITRHGVPALEDRRQRYAQFRPATPAPPPAVQVAAQESGIVVDFGAPGPRVCLPAANVLQTRVFLLTLLDNGHLGPSQVADLLGYSAGHTARLAGQLRHGDVTALLDQRRGQRQDYRVTAEVKAQLIQQFVVDLLTRGTTSAEALARELQQRCQLALAPRTVRYHLARLGLGAVRHSLPALLAEVKKTSPPSS